MALRGAPRLGLGRRVAAVDVDPARPREPKRPADDGGQFIRVVESADEEPPPGDGQPDHRAGHHEARARRHLTCEEPPERGRHGKLPAILHAVDEVAQRWCEAPRCDHPIERRRLIEARHAGRWCGIGERRCARGVRGEWNRAARADRVKQQHVQGAFAVGARVVRNADLAAKAARPREEPVQHLARRTVISQSLQHRRFALVPGQSGPPRPPPDPAPRSARTDPAPAAPTARRRPPGGGGAPPRGTAF